MELQTTGCHAKIQFFPVAPIPNAANPFHDVQFAFYLLDV
jgi:hypothetical protein